MTTSRPDVCQTALKGTYQGEEFVNVLHFFKVDGTDLTAADLTAIHGILDDAPADTDAWRHIWQDMDSNAVVTEIHSRTMSTTAPIEVISTVSLAGGSAGADALPMLAAMLKWTGPFATRRSRGRTYLTGLTTSHWDASDTDQLSAATLAALAGHAEAFQNAWQANATYGFCIWSRQDALENNPTPVYEVRGGSCAAQIAIQTRRSPNR